MRVLRSSSFNCIHAPISNDLEWRYTFLKNIQIIDDYFSFRYATGVDVRPYST